MLQVRDEERFPQALGFESLDLFLGVGRLGPCLTAIQEDGSDKRLVQFKLVCQADGVASPDRAIAATAEAILMRTSTEQVPSSYRVGPRNLKPVTSPNFWPFMLILFCLYARLSQTPP